MTTPEKAPRVARCPICKSPASDGNRPFCSRRCSDIDLGRWFTGSYAIAGNDDDGQSDKPSLPLDGNSET